MAGWAGDGSPVGCFSLIIAGMGSMLHVIHILSGIRAIWNFRFGHLHLLLLSFEAWLEAWLNPARQRLSLGAVPHIAAHL